MAKPQRRHSKASSKSRSSSQGKPRAPRDVLTSLRTTYKRLRTQLRKIRSDLATFQDQDLPAWHSWMEECFAAKQLLREELHQEYNVLAGRLLTAETLLYSGHCRTRRAAYQEALRRENDPSSRGEPIFGPDLDDDLNDDLDVDLNDHPVDDLDPDHPFSYFDFDGEPGDNPMVDFLLDQFLIEVRGVDPGSLSAADYQKAKDLFLETIRNAQSGDKLNFEKSLLRIGADESSENVRQVKSLYRSLAKLFHPDQNPDAGDLEKEFWGEAQVAYQALNPLALESLELRYRLEKGQDPKPEDRSILELIVDDLSTQRELLREELNDARTEPAWGFSSLPPEIFDQLSQETGRSLNREISELRRDIEELRRQESKLTSPPPPKTPPKTRPPKPAPVSNAEQMEIPF